MCIDVSSGAACDAFSLPAFGAGADAGFDYPTGDKWHVKQGTVIWRRASVEITSSRLAATLQSDVNAIVLHGQCSFDQANTILRQMAGPDKRSIAPRSDFIDKRGLS